MTPRPFSKRQKVHLFFFFFALQHDDNCLSTRQRKEKSDRKDHVDRLIPLLVQLEIKTNLLINDSWNMDISDGKCNDYQGQSWL